MQRELALKVIAALDALVTVLKRIEDGLSPGPEVDLPDNLADELPPLEPVDSPISKDEAEEPAIDADTPTTADVAAEEVNT